MPDVRFSNQYPYTDFHELNLDWVIKTVSNWRDLVGKTIQSIELTGTAGLVDTYTITYSDGTTSTFNVTNGNGIVSVAKTGTAGLVDTYTITFQDGNTSTFNVTNGNGILSVAKTGTAGLVDTYTITFQDGSTSTFDVTNGTAAVTQTTGSSITDVMSQAAVTSALLDNTAEDVDLADAITHDLGLDTIISEESTPVIIKDGTIVFGYPRVPTGRLNYVCLNNSIVSIDGSGWSSYDYPIIAKGTNGVVILAYNTHIYYLTINASLALTDLGQWTVYNPSAGTKTLIWKSLSKGLRIFFYWSTGILANVTMSETEINNKLSTAGISDTVTITLGFSKSAQLNTPCKMEFFHLSDTAGEYPLEGTIINCFGDSITQGIGSSDQSVYSYPARLAEMSRATVNNYGTSGSRIAEIAGDSVPSFVERWANMSNADMVIVFGGINDFYKASPIGTMADTLTSTFYGALKNVIGGLAAKNPYTKLAFVIPYQTLYSGHTSREDLGEGTLNDYRTAIKEVCEYYSVPVLDLFNDWGYSFPDSSYARAALSDDGLHLNDAGYLYLANRVYEWVKTLI